MTIAALAISVIALVTFCVAALSAIHQMHPGAHRIGTAEP